MRDMTLLQRHPNSPYSPLQCRREEQKRPSFLFHGTKKTVVFVPGQPRRRACVEDPYGGAVMGALLAILLLFPQEKPETRRGGFLDDVNLHDLTMHVQKVTQKTILWSEELGLRGKRTHYVTDRPIGDDPVLLFKAYQHILQWNDLVLVRAEKENEEIYKITTLAVGLKKPIPLVREPTDPSERFITRVFTLQNASPRALWQTLAPMVSIAQNILPVEESGALIITDYESNLRRLEEILKIVDVKKPDLE